MKKLMEIYQEKMQQRMEKQKEAIKNYIRNARAKKIAEKLTPYRDEVLQMVETYGVEETRKIINTSLSMKIRTSIFGEVLQHLKEKQKQEKNKK